MTPSLSVPSCPVLSCSIVSHVPVYDPATGTWAGVPSSDFFVPTARGFHTALALALGDELVIYGGSSGVDPATGTPAKYLGDIWRGKISAQSQA